MEKFPSCLWIGSALLTLVSSQNFYTHGRYGERHGTRAYDLLMPKNYYDPDIGQLHRTVEIPRDMAAILPQMNHFSFGSEYEKRSANRGAWPNDLTEIIERFDNDEQEVSKDDGCSMTSSQEFDVRRC